MKTCFTAKQSAAILAVVAKWRRGIITVAEMTSALADIFDNR